MVARITKYYVEVLGARGDPLEPQLSGSLSLSGTVSYELTANRSMSSSLNMIQTETTPKEMIESISSSLVFGQTIEFTTASANNISFTSAVEVHGILRKDVSNSISFTDTFTGTRDIDVFPVSGGAEFDPDTGTVTPKTFVFNVNATYNAIFIRPLSSSLLFQQTTDDSIGPEESNSFSFGQSVTVEQVKTMSNGLVFGQNVVVRRSSTNPSGENTIRFDHTVNYSVDRVNFDCNYTPFSGGTSDPNTSNLFPPEPETTTRDYVELKYPPESPTTILTLKGPELSDRYRLNFQRINRETRGGTLIVFADSIWPKTQTLSLQFIGLSETEGQEVLNFIDLTLGKQIDIVDWKSRTWRGIITTPQEPLVRNHNCNLAVNFDFEGGQLINSVQETSLIIFVTHVYIGLFSRPEEDNLIFTQIVVYTGIFERPETNDLIFTQSATHGGSIHNRSESGELEFTQTVFEIQEFNRTIPDGSLEFIQNLSHSQEFNRTIPDGSLEFTQNLSHSQEFERPESDSLEFTQTTVYVCTFERPESDSLEFTQTVFEIQEFNRTIPDGSLEFIQETIKTVIEAKDTPWIGLNADKLYLQSGQFSSTLKTSEFVGGIDAGPRGISWDGINTPWIGDASNKFYLTSGQFTSTLKTSQLVIVDSVPEDISWDGTNTPWCGSSDDKLYLQSGQFSSTLVTSRYVATNAVGISWDGTNTPWCGWSNNKLVLQSGQFSSTVKISLSATSAAGVSWDGVDTPWISFSGAKLYLQSGQFYSTIKDSRYVGGIDSQPMGIDTNKFLQRLS